ncbi:Hsp20/alpha crystallin family protein [Natronolimnobius baerhuensis]|uniref:Heat-shock protein Hsp20 n=1 Tax=Natronolimnobius baerhuensis TaxID=253108 RepID=A0A202E8J4_9EURY|nr:Hsp20/alpha crystallin family protein [Natronolimnobius baerhuensis]OVE84557.1 heat-shock protein Hsp20 [Natronolimnobius baerhuensis]
MTLREFGRSISNNVYRQVGRTNSYLQSNRSLPVDVLESESAYLVVFDAPGTEPEDIEVRYLSGSVKIRLERYREFRDRYDVRFPGRGLELDGDVALPGDAVVNPDAGTARLTEHGTLRIEIPKDESLAEETDADGDGEDEHAVADHDHTEHADSIEPGEVTVND